VAAKVPLSDLEKTIQEWLTIPEEDSRLVPKAEEVVGLIRSAISENEALRRYRETRERMGKPEKYSLEVPNFPYTVQSS